MAYVIAAPEMMTAAASDLATIGSNVSAAHLVAAARTTSVVPAAADEVSTGIAQLFSQHAANYQALAGQAAAFNDQFVQHLTAGAFSYADVEAAIASLLQSWGSLFNTVFSNPFWFTPVGSALGQVIVSLLLGAGTLFGVLISPPLLFLFILWFGYLLLTGQAII